MTDPAPPKKPIPSQKRKDIPQKKGSSKPSRQKGELPFGLSLPVVSAVGILIIAAGFILTTKTGNQMMQQVVDSQVGKAEQIQRDTRSASQVPTDYPSSEGGPDQSESSQESKVPSYAGPIGDVTTGQPAVIDTLEDIFPVPEMKRDIKTTKEEFYARSDLYETEEVLKDPLLAYSVRLPKGWEHVKSSLPQSMELSVGVLGLIDYYVGPQKQEWRSSFRIKAQKINHMMTPKDWLYQYALAARYTLQAMSSYGDDRAEGLYILNEPDVSYVSRIVVIFNADRVVTAEYLVPVSQFQAERDDQIWSTVSFYLKRKDPSPIEPIKYYNFLDISATEYPGSWILQKDYFETTDQMSASILNVRMGENGVVLALLGRIDMYMVAGGDDFSMDEAFVYINKKLEKHGVQIREPIADFKPFPRRKSLKQILARKFELNDSKNTFADYEYWVTALRGESYYMFICLLTPPQSPDFYNWARNISAYRQVIAGLHEGL